MKLFERLMQKQCFQDLLVIWDGHLRGDSHAGAGLMATYLLEMLRDPHSAQARQDCTLFVNLMAPRKWPEMLKELTPYLSDVLPDTTRFRSESAEPFYETFRSIVTKTIKDYYDNLEGIAVPSPTE